VGCHRAAARTAAPVGAVAAWLAAARAAPIQNRRRSAGCADATYFAMREAMITTVRCKCPATDDLVDRINAGWQNKMIKSSPESLVVHVQQPLQSNALPFL
jgi:hypothetical protein